MKKRTEQAINTPFENLAKALEIKGVVLEDAPARQEKPLAGQDRPRTPIKKDMDDSQVFAAWMADVKPLPKGGRLAEEEPAFHEEKRGKKADSLSAKELEALVQSGRGFVVSQTAEYVEGALYGVHGNVTQRLHRGDFSIQAHIDLHGLDVQAAQEAFDLFFSEAVGKGRRTVLVIHGRGLSSPGDPVLKTRVLQWLTQGPWRKWVIAFASAPACEGGAGATLVLLRNRPLGSRQRKGKPSMPLSAP